jgi:hypothetical protein
MENVWILAAACVGLAFVTKQLAWRLPGWAPSLVKEHSKKERIEATC